MIFMSCWLPSDYLFRSVVDSSTIFHHHRAKLKHLSGFAGMSRQVLSLVLLLHLTSCIQQTVAAPAKSLIDGRQASDRDSEFGLRAKLSIAEWLAVQGQRIELAENITRACLSQFPGYEDNSVCYGDDRWDWSTINIVSIVSTLVGLMFGVWLCYYWVQRAILWLLDEGDDPESATTETSSYPVPQPSRGQEIQTDAQESNFRVGSARSRDKDVDNSSASRGSNTRVNSAYSQAQADEVAIPQALGARRTNSTFPSFAPPDMSVADKSS